MNNMDKTNSMILNATSEEIQEKAGHSQKISWKIFGKKLKAFYPSRKFPTISITGSSCEQNCLYCNKHYLKQMIPITTPNKMFNFAMELEKKGGNGFLISGGFTKESVLPIEPFLKTIQEIKDKTNLKINIHPGLIKKEEAQAIFEAKIDTVSFDLITDDQIIDELLGNGYRGNDYLKTFDSMISVGLKVIPHICLGLYYGTEKGNIDAINAALKRNPKLLVFIGLIPTKNTPMENSKTIDPTTFLKLLVYTRLKEPKVEQSLGCMRVRFPIFENYAIKAGINRIAVPKRKSLIYAKQAFGLEIEKISSCCVI
ncbi:MAG: radical SAM protein [Asgard group archaeon]|nr:radical SAM protein [Asgard group archaeon]